MVVLGSPTQDATTILDWGMTTKLLQELDLTPTIIEPT